MAALLPLGRRIRRFRQHGHRHVSRLCNAWPGSCQSSSISLSTELRLRSWISGDFGLDEDKIQWDLLLCLCRVGNWTAKELGEGVLFRFKHCGVADARSMRWTGF